MSNQKTKAEPTKEPAVTITRAQFFEAYGLAMTIPPWSKQILNASFAEELARQLGLGSKDHG